MSDTPKTDFVEGRALALSSYTQAKDMFLNHARAMERDLTELRNAAAGYLDACPADEDTTPAFLAATRALREALGPEWSDPSDGRFDRGCS